jgi:hypothetical protein
MATVAEIQEALVSRVASVQEALKEGIDASDLFHDEMRRPWIPASDKYVAMSSLYPTYWFSREPQNVA